MPPIQICGEGLQNGGRLARHCPLQIHADLMGELLLPHSITRASGEAGPSPEQEALSGSPRLVVELLHRRTQFYRLV